MNISPKVVGSVPSIPLAFPMSEVNYRRNGQKYSSSGHRHAEDFVREKLAPAEPRNDGRQTPMRGHPVFKAMHGSAMCCRGCMEKWWKVRRGARLTEVQQLKAVEFLMAWIAKKQDEEA